MPITLEYQGNAGLQDMSAFNTRLQQAWRGDNLFRVYAVEGSLYFIRVGGSKNANAAVSAQFGLLGILITYFVNKRNKRKQQETLNTIAGTDPRELLGSHKYNFVLPLNEITSATILPKSFLGGNSGRCDIVLATGKKRKCTFDDVENMRGGIAQLATALGSKLDVQAEFDSAKNRFRKPTVEKKFGQA